MVHRGRFGRDVHFGVNEARLRLARAVRHDLDDGELHDPVDEKVHAGRFQVEKDQRYIVGKLHDISFFENVLLYYITKTAK